MKCKKMVGAIGPWDKEITQRQQSGKRWIGPEIFYYALFFFMYLLSQATLWLLQRLSTSQSDKSLFIIYEGIQCTLWDRININSPNNIIGLVETISDWRSARTLYGGVSLSLVVSIFFVYHEPNLDQSISKLQSPTWSLKPEPGTTSSNKNT